MKKSESDKELVVTLKDAGIILSTMVGLLTIHTFLIVPSILDAAAIDCRENTTQKMEFVVERIGSRIDSLHEDIRALQAAVIENRGN